MKNVKTKIVMLMILSTLTVQNINLDLNFIIIPGNGNTIKIEEKSPED